MRVLSGNLKKIPFHPKPTKILTSYLGLMSLLVSTLLMHLLVVVDVDVDVGVLMLVLVLALLLR